MDPATISALFGAGSKVLGAGSGPAGPSRADFGPSTIGFDNSNWTVATSGSKAGAQLHPAVLAGGAVLALLIVWRLTKKS